MDRSINVARVQPATPPDTVVCAVGDVHGCLDLLEAAIAHLEAIGSDALQRGKRLITVFLGDYIDRGPDSRGVIERLIELQQADPERWLFLRGNHEQVVMDLLDQVDPPAAWLEFGGAATLRSYGVSTPSREAGAPDRQTVQALLRSLPPTHLDFLRRTELCAKLGDYTFVHAGLRPDRLLEEQSPGDMLWFRYYEDQRPVHGEMVVHGHSPNPTPIEGRWRIGIDTGAYATGDLTLLRLEDAERQFLKVSRRADGVDVKPWSSLDSSYANRDRARSDAAARSSPDAQPRRFPIVAVVAALLALMAAIALVGTSILRTHRVALHRTVVAAPAPRPIGPSIAAPKATPSLARLRAMEVLAEPSPTWAGQVAAVDSPDQARAVWRGFLSEFPAELGSRRLKIEPVAAGEGTLYRTYVVGFHDIAEARAFCATLRAARHDCLLRKVASAP